MFNDGSTPDLGYLLALVRFRKFGAVRLGRLRAAFPSMRSAFLAQKQELVRAGIDEKIADEFIFQRDDEAPGRELALLQEHGVAAVRYEDGAYPSLLKELYDAPAVLFLRGTLPPRGAKALAVVGSRHPTKYGEQVVRDIVEPIARAGVTIVSGLAYGIDAFAHEAACRALGRTVAILAAGADADSIYPTRNRALASHMVAKGGALVSEFPIGTQIHKSNFPIRNRIIAGLCEATLVVEAARESGSLITARAALESNREVFAVPGSLFNPMSEGPNNLIKMGARPVTTPDDILSVFGLAPRADEPAPEAGSDEEARLLALLSQNPIHADELTRTSGLPSSVVTSTLTLMEMKGSARHMGGMYYVRG